MLSHRAQTCLWIALVPLAFAGAILCRPSPDLVISLKATRSATYRASVVLENHGSRPIICQGLQASWVVQEQNFPMARDPNPLTTQLITVQPGSTQRVVAMLWEDRPLPIPLRPTGPLEVFSIRYWPERTKLRTWGEPILKSVGFNVQATGTVISVELPRP